MPDRVGQQLGNYQLLRLLGEGGFAEVYLGEHIYLGIQAAVKLLHTQLAQSDIEQFRQEARTIAHLEHPHIVRVLDFGIEGTTPFLIMSYAPGGTLRARHPKGTRLPTDLVVSYVNQVASALQYAHDHKVIHRDMKPENLLLGSSNDILLSDFGIALIAQSSRYQNTTDMVGTIAYMAPEQIAGHPRTASDQYALGIVVYEWLCGTRPFHGSFTEIAAQHCVTPPPPPRQHLPTLSPEIEQVIMTALAKRPEDRFASVQVFALALEQASQINLPTEPARLAPFSSQLPPSDTPVPPPITVTQPADPSSHSTIPTSTTEAPPAVIPKELVRALGRKQGASRRLALLVPTGLIIIALVSGLIWSTFSHGASSISIVHPTTSHGASSGSIVHPTTPAGNVTEFPLPTSDRQPTGITTGPDGNLWFAGTFNIGRISTSGSITEFPLPTSRSLPHGITAGPDGNLWFTEQISNKIGRISTSGTITEFPLPTSDSNPLGITAGPDGNFWFTENNGNKIGRISTSGTITEFPLPTSTSSPNEITAGPDGNLWFTEIDKIGRISTSGTITEFPLSTSGSIPQGITAGPDGNLWFADYDGNKIGRISTSGSITEFPLPTSGSQPGGIAAGPDGSLWFAEYGGNKIGRMTTGK